MGKTAGEPAEKRPRRTAASRSVARPTGLGSARYLQLFEKLNPLVGLLDFGKVSARACELIAELLDVAACSLLVMDDADKTLVLHAATHIPESEWRNIRVAQDKTPGGRVLRDGKALLINGRVNFRKQFGRDPYERYLTPSCAIVPLPLLGRICGVINIAHPIGRRAFMQRDVALLEAAANIIGSALATANQYQEAREQQNYLVGIFDSLHVGLLAVDAHGRVINANTRLRKNLNLPPSGPIQQTLSELLPGTLFNVCARLIRDSRQDDEPTQDRVVFEDKSVKKSLEITAAPLHPMGGVNGHHLLIIEDLSKDEEVKRLREAEDMKRSFLSIISHELRTPIAVIRPALSLIDPGVNGGVAVDTLNQVHKLLVKNTNRLNDVVSAILDVTEIETGTLKLALRPVDIRELFEEIIGDQADRARTKEIIIEREFGPDSTLITGDRRRLRQVFAEMIDNALKFCNPGNKVRIETRNLDPWMVVEISNNGPMIEMDRRKNLFEKFYQCNQTMTRSVGGCGLGLFLARNILRLHGGSIELKDSNSEQTTFVMKLPLGVIVSGGVGMRPAHDERDV